MSLKEKRELFGAVTLFARVDVLDEWLHDHGLRWIARRTTGAWMGARIRRGVRARMESNGVCI